MKKIEENRYIITGFSGFVARHFIEFLNTLESKSIILGIDINDPEYSFDKLKKVSCIFKKVNLNDIESLESVLLDFKPNFILHLASFSSVAFSWNYPLLTFQNNTSIFLNLIEAVRKININPRIISVGSSEEYGNVNAHTLPLKESYVVNPVSPYAVARVSQELFSRVYVSGYNLDIILTRSFNHIGPYQKDIFVVSSFVKKILESANNKSESLIETGDLSIIRDFVDVRDVVRAYYLLFQKGTKGEVYNICSGKGHSLSDIVEMISKISKINVETILNKKFVRPDDNKVIIGTYEKLKKQTGWTPKISLEESLSDIINYWKNIE